MKRISLCLTLLLAFGPRVSAQSQLTERLTLKGHGAPIIALAFSGDGKTLATASDDKIVRLWNVTTGVEIRALKDVSVSANCLTFSRDGRTLAVDGVLWDVSSGRVKDTPRGIGGPLAVLTPDGIGQAYLRFGNNKDEHWAELRLLDLATKKERVVTRWSEPGNVPDSTHYGTCLAISADGKTVAVGHAFPLADNTSALSWVDLASGKERQTGLPVPGRLGGGACLSFSGDGKMLVAAGTDSICVLDVASAKVTAVLNGKGPGPLAINADSMSLAAVGPNNTVKIWTIQTGENRAEKMKDYLSKDGSLKERLTLEITQGGGGITGAYSGTVWIIKPSGAWTQETTAGFAGGERQRKLVAKGQLTQQQRLALAHHLAVQDFKALPARVTSRGPGDVSGSLDVAIDFGKKRTDLSTARGSLTDSAPKADDPRASEWSRFVALTLVLQDLLQGDKTEPKKDK